MLFFIYSIKTEKRKKVSFMAIFYLKSDNPKLSYAISKNPESPPLVKKIRKGLAVGLYAAPDVYFIFFKDALNELSYDNEFNYNDMSQFNSPYFILNATNNYFNSTIKKEHECDTVSNNEVSFHIEIKRQPFIEKSFRFVEDKLTTVTYEEVSPNSNQYLVTIRSTSTLHYLLNLVNVFALMVAMTNEKSTYLEPEQTLKYLYALNVIESNYFFRYLFKLKAIRSPKELKNTAHLLNGPEELGIDFSYGSTQDARKSFVLNHISQPQNIIDIGCGDGAYTLVLAKKYYPNEVSAIDIDDEVLTIVKNKAKVRNLENISTYSSLEIFKETHAGNLENSTVLLMEVIEHMPLGNAKLFLKEVLSLNAKEYIISTPCLEFNKNYILEDFNGFRHHDHHFELTTIEFKALIDSILDELNLNLVATYSLVGDNVKGFSPTQAVIITKKED